jgi:hypothetical protein
MPHSSKLDEIKQMPKTSVHLQPESRLLGKHLTELELEIDPTFDVNKWLQEWDGVEMAIKQESLARESRILMGDAEQAVKLKLTLRQQGWQLEMADAFSTIIALRHDYRHHR